MGAGRGWNASGGGARPGGAGLWRPAGRGPLRKTLTFEEHWCWSRESPGVTQLVQREQQVTL